MNDFPIELYAQGGAATLGLMFLIQVVKLLRDWIVFKKVNEKLIDSLKEMKDELSIMKAQMVIIDERTEHSSFIPEFEIKINSYINTVIQGFTFKDNIIKNVARSTLSNAKDIFTNIIKIGFSKYDVQSTLADFSMLDLKLTGMVQSYVLKVNASELRIIMNSEKSSFLVAVNELIDNKSNGERQTSFVDVSKEYVHNVLKEISKL